MADRGIRVRSPAGRAWIIHTAGHSGRQIGLTPIAAMGDREHGIVGIQDLRVSSVSTRRNTRSPTATTGTDYDRQALTLLNR